MKNIINVDNELNFPEIYNINSYISFVNKIPLLSKEEEENLAIKLKYENNLEAAKKLVIHHLQYVVKISREFYNYGLPQEDLIQEGNIGLMKAVRNYDIEKGVRLSTYAYIWIKSEIQEYILNNWKIVKIATTNNLKKLFFNFRTLKNKLSQNIDNNLNKKIAEELSVNEKEVYEIENYFQQGHIVEIDNEYDEDGNTFDLIDESDSVEIAYIKKEKELKKQSIIKNLPNLLNEKEMMIIKNRYLTEEQMSLNELSKILNMSIEGVRKLENRIIEKIKNNI